MKNIFITGVTGFIGSHMLEFLLKNQKDINIFGIRRSESSTEHIKNFLEFKNFNLFFADLLDAFSLEKIIKDIKPDYFYHFASQSSVVKSFNTPIDTLQTNIIGTINILEIIKKIKDEDKNYHPKFLNISSSEVYSISNEESLIKEHNDFFSVSNLYSISKLTQEMIGQYYQKAFNLNIITVRFFSCQGSRRNNKFALPSFAHQIVLAEEQNSRPIINVGNLDDHRIYTHIDDIVNACYLAIEKGKNGEIYNVSREKSCSLREVLEIMLELSSIPRKLWEINTQQSRLNISNMSSLVNAHSVDISKFTKDTNWKPTKTINDLCQDLLDYWRAIVNKTEK